ncbi:MAG: class II fructose-bisphosphate aldolase [Kiritimatiellales bacterium]
MLVTTQDMLKKAQKGKYAVPAINTQGGNYDIIRSICLAAEEAQSPIMLAHYVATGQYSGDDWFVEVSKWWANRVSVPVAIHLDHGDTFERCMKAMKLGFTSLMLDCSSESIEDNAKHTNEVIKAAHAIGIPVEAEVGELARNDGSGNMVEAKNIANVEDIKKFVSLCQPDSLAIGIGNMHGYYKGEPVIRLDVLKQAAAITDIPLVLHGCTGMKDEVVKEAIQIGVAKINFGTLVRHKYVDFYKEAIDTLPHDGHSWKISQFAEKKLRGVIKEIIDLSGSAGKA